MDEQAGPGVFFNNNNSVLTGGGKGPLPDGDAGEAARAQYSIPGILHFLQHEWARFEVERAQWEVERAELQAQIAFLQGERKGQENLKKDLVRRIKMLEYALKQERAKYHKLKYGTELNQGDMKPPSYDSDEANENETSGSLNNQLSWKQGRQLLRQYLQEVGYTDTILDVKSQRVRALLGLAGDGGGRAGERTSTEPLVNGTDTKGMGTRGKAELSDTSAVLEAFKFIENAAAEFSDEDDDEDSEGKDRTHVESRTILRKKPQPSSSLPASMDTTEDPDTEEALKGFDFLSSPDEMDTSPESRGTGDGTDWEKDEQGPISEAWDVDPGMITKLKEQYRKERKGKKGVKRPNRSKLQDMLANLRDAEDLSHMQPPSAPQSRPNVARFNEHEGNRTDEVEALTFPPTSGKSFIMGTEEAMESELGLGELAGLTVANEADSLAYDIGNNKDAMRKTWNPKFTLRSHFDGIRALVFHPVEPVLVTASEDHTLKMWNLQKTAPAKKSTSLDVEPIYTFRAHRGAVLSVVMSSTGEQCFSGGVDGTIQCWNTPNPNIDPYDSYDPSVLRGELSGHTDSVWGLVYSSAHQRLLSCSADGTVRLWDANTTSPALAVFNENKQLGVPSSVDLVCSDPAYLVTSFTNGEIGLFNMETRQLVLSLESNLEPGTPCQINKVLSHPTLPITITAQEDRHIKFFDNNSGKMIHSMVAHLDAVTSLAVDPNGLYLMSGSHDCSIRLWNLDSKTCIQEFTAHRKKFEESIHDVAFHPSKCYIASAGADALAKVFV
ncbi:striatin isoform X2 [Hippoglossus stenolepis]|uniref:striatin isoform X1 n=1 Tax=Hippoglossus stenolepis TaxID=195615 RepID=UPI00159C3F7E|nr:striatin isoform X1 [Hippoglossus stenolepis]XP_035029333.1 striatin isoform X2 [Hippoglossus stenolepis]